MIAVIQRVTEARVEVAGSTVSQIGPGLLILLGVAKGDTPGDCAYLAGKIANMRVFSNDDGKFGLSLLEVKGSALVVSQFTLLGSWRKGRRPGFENAAAPEEAEPLVGAFISELEKLGVQVKSGIFGADMKVFLVNDGPVTFCLDAMAKD